MNIRKCAALLAVAVSLCAASAENSRYASHLAKAKECEAKKQWIAALGEYYEAMLAEPTLAAQEAYNGWTALADDIKSGKPGHGTFDVFEQYDCWITFMQEYERYWTEHCPRVIIFNMPKRTKINTADRTATYTVGVSWQWSEKYSAMHTVITEGYKKAYTSEWNAAYLKDWPERSVYNAPADKGKFLQNGAVQTQNWTIIKTAGRDGRGNIRYIDEYFYEKIFVFGYGPLYTRPAFSANYPHKEYYNGMAYASYETTMYDIQFNIITSDKKIIFQSQRTLVCPDAKYTFTATAEQMKYLDAGKIAFVPVALYLKYGDHTNVDIVPNSRAWVNNLPEVQVSLSKTPFDVKSESTGFYSDVKDYFNNNKNAFAVNVIDKLVKDRQEAEDRKRQEAEIIEQKWSEICGDILSNQTAVFTKGTVTARTIEPRYFDYEENYRYDCETFAELRTKLTAEYGEEKYEQVKLYMLCNSLSKAENLDPAYSVGGANKNSYMDEMEFLIANYDKISCNQNASGYRIPTAEETALFADLEHNGKKIIVRAASAEEKQKEIERQRLEEAVQKQQEAERQRLAEERKRKDAEIAEQNWKKLCDDILHKERKSSLQKLFVILFPPFYLTYDTNNQMNYAHYYNCEVFSEMRTKMIAEYGEEKYEQVKLYMICNGLSKSEHREPAYSVAGKNKDSYAEEMAFLLANYDKISCDTKASGYRLSTDKERKDSIKMLKRQYSAPEQYLFMLRAE
ncbi:MAG: hypothetical protein K2I74_06475 [Treponemataceae bacterium]|nr:hypothetical protein [Treponemataceae bacterium]